MLPAPAVIGHLLRMSGREVCRATDVACIRGAAGVAAHECGFDAAVVDGSGVAALPRPEEFPVPAGGRHPHLELDVGVAGWLDRSRHPADRKSTRLNSSHLVISYAVFCLKKKKINSSIHSFYLKTNLNHDA